MSILTTKAFYVALIERAVKSGAQAAAVAFTTDVTGVLELDWTQTGSIIGLMILASIATSFASIPVSNSGPSLGGEVLEKRNTHRADTPPTRTD